MTEPDSIRSRTVTWQNPMIGARAALGMTGLEYMRALLDGSVPPPPIIALMDMRPTAVEVGKVTFECKPNESHYNPIGTVTKPGSRAAFAEGIVTDAAGRLVATASSTLLVFPAQGESAQGGPGQGA